MDATERFRHILAINAWIQGGFTRHGSDNILVFRRERAVFDLMCVALDSSATPVEGSELALSDEELEQCYQFCLHHLAAKRLPDSRLVSLLPLLWGYARLCIGPLPPLHNVEVYEDSWEYEDRERAFQAFREWNPVESPEPPGWHRHPASGRYRPGGDPAKEYVKE